MPDLITAILPLVFTFALGVVLRAWRVFAAQDADILLKLFFYLCLPALILISVSTMHLRPSLLFLPGLSAAIILITFVIGKGIAPILDLPRTTLGVFYIGILVMNGGFTFPYVLSAYGAEGMAIASLFDFGTGLMVFTFVYYLACRHGQSGSNHRQLLTKFLLSPPLLSLIVALTLNVTHTALPSLIINWFTLLSNMTTPVVMLALGIAFRPHLVRLGSLASVIVLRMGLGFVLAQLCVHLMGIDGMMRHIVVMMASAPSGVNTLAFATMEGLDKEFAAAVVSYTTLIGMIWFPFYLSLAV
ncbi:AEC family transporter [Desulfuromonas acetoxidans]|uniref:Auxin Efflux Carrier n=1 Tax=Desulfuromonas acetoxidans (strain DSM 684 / 11070) TaxID=281689 RepID=Q1K1N5_DESA6|nr:AEC family transporter [Desulfuromonas acetoxidans]EAT16353.1 Auxin Efflux Carrier [Desulfuromonas acetoxidans DSM 684]MBF0645970.1 AEC family transporter [Desulfuromonas acetoxidans]NVD23492.1 AEC family transporter [Desulfuromonas acetoxidans]NVE16122.1 AEC family transporter [Desulfuromonas acetoxidans]